MRVRRVADALALVAAGAPAAAQAKPQVRMTFDARFGLALVTKGFNAFPVAPAKQDGLDFRLPVRKVIDRRGERIVRTRGGFLLNDPADDVRIGLTKILFEIEGRRLTMTGLASIEGITYDRFAFAGARLAKKNRRKATLRLNGTAVAALNSQQATTEFKRGQQIGVVRLPR